MPHYTRGDAVAFHLKPLCVSPNIWPHVCPTSRLENEQFACRWLPLSDSKDNIWESVRNGREISQAYLMHSLLYRNPAEMSFWKRGLTVSAKLSSTIIEVADTVVCHYGCRALKWYLWIGSFCLWVCILQMRRASTVIDICLELLADIRGWGDLLNAKLSSCRILLKCSF